MADSSVSITSLISVGIALAVVGWTLFLFSGRSASGVSNRNVGKQGRREPSFNHSSWNNDQSTDDFIFVSCPSCVTNLRISRATAATRIRCPKCKTTFDWSKPSSAQSGDSENSKNQSKTNDPIKAAFDTLEIQPESSSDEIRAAFMKRRSEYHPDKVATLGKSLREAATEKLKDINAAYELLKKMKRV